jgi:hypothetical protein
LLGVVQQFAATVGNASDTAVSWSVNGIPGGNITVGTISANGLYTAPQILPAGTPIVVAATSRADGTKSATATVSLLSDIAVGVTPATADVELGALLQVQATVASAGNPNRAVNWTVAGPGCAGSACGTVDPGGLYTAPQIRPAPPGVTLTASSVADPSKAARVAINITSNFTLTVSGPALVTSGATAQFTATLTPAPNSNPSLLVTWSVSGPGCSGTACGTLTASGSYTAPGVAPSPSRVNVTATPAADPGKAATMAVTIGGAVSVSITPTAATRAINHLQTFTVQVTGTTNQTLQWQVNGIPGGDATVGQICAANVTPCQQVSMTAAGSVDYLAPGSLPTRNPVTITAASQADPAQSASAQVTILPYVVVSVSPASVTLAPSAAQPFTSSVAGTSNQNVFWQLSGTACGSAGSPCGIIDATGFYAAPAAPPSPNTLAIVATSAEDTSRFGTATVTITTGANIAALLPASATAGAAGGFPLVVEGSGFVPSSPGPGSTIIFNGSPRNTSCPSSGECSTSLAAADLTAAGNLPVQIRNPGGTASNQVFLVVVALATSEDVIPLAPAAPSATGKDIVVVEPSTAGTSTLQNSVNLNIVALGLFSVSSNNCVLGGSPLRLLRPASGTADVDVCAFSPSGLDPSLTYTLTGPAPNDISIIARQPLGLGIVRLTLELGSTAATGPRSLFVENPNKDKSAATGALEVK